MAEALQLLPGRSERAAWQKKRTERIRWRGPFVPLPGERWAAVEGLDLQVSTLGRGARISSGRLLQVHAAKPPHRPYPHFRGRSTIGIPDFEITTARAFGLAFGNRRDAKRGTAWTAADEELFLQCRNAEEAAERLERTVKACERRAEKLRHRWPAAAPAGEARVSAERLWLQAKAAVPAWIPEHERQDLISEVLIARLEGDTAPWAELFKAARTRHNLLVGAFKERSLDAPIRPGEDFSFGELLADDCERF